MTNYTQGVGFEYFVRNWYSWHGYFVFRSAGSKSPVDLIAINKSEIIFIQCKKEKSKKNYEEDLAKLREVPDISNSRKELWVKRNGGFISVYDQFGELLGETTMKRLRNGN